MTTATSLFREVGGHVFPTTETDESTLASLDPGRDVVLDLLADALNDEIGPRWADAISNTPLSATSNPVESRHPFPPSPEFFTSRKVPFPALFIARVSSEWGRWSLERWQATTTWKVAYVLGALTPGAHRKLYDVTSYGVSVIRATLSVGGHKAHATHPSDDSVPRLVLGRGPTVDGYANFSSVVPGNAEYSDREVFENGDAKTYYAAAVTFQTVELYDQRASTGPPGFDIDYSFGITGDGGTLPDAVQAKTDVPFQEG